MNPWSREQIAKSVGIFPEGQFGIEIEGRLAASSSSLIIEYDPKAAWHNWKEVSDDGYIRNHDPAGDTLYGIEMMVHPDFRGMKLSRRLYDSARSCAGGTTSRGRSSAAAFPATANTPTRCRPASTSSA